MESFLEANRVVEVSLNKFSHVSKGHELPLRKALLISKAMNKAQVVAESAHTSFLNSVSTTRCSSRLLASMQSSADVEDTAVHELDPSLVRPWTNKPRLLPSPVATAHCSRSAAAVRDDDMMDMETVISANSVLSDILSSGEEEMEVSSPPPPLQDLSNSRDWSAATWPEVNAAAGAVKSLPLGTDSRWTAERTSPPPSPGKRHHSVAFPPITDSSWLFDFTTDDVKRFKPSLPENNSSSLPGIYGCLSPRNLCSAPLITYMFGRGFTTPSNPSVSDWPTATTLEREQCDTSSHLFNQSLSPSKLCPILAY